MDCAYCGKPLVPRTYPDGRSESLTRRNARRHCDRICMGRSTELAWVDSDGPPWRESEGGCWVWDRNVASNGYGHITTSAGKVTAHRWVYEQAVEPVPHRMEVHHRCRNRACVNPDHLQVVTSAENKWLDPPPHFYLTADTVRAIRAAVADGSTNRHVARTFGCSERYVSDLVQRKAWAYLKEEG